MPENVNAFAERLIANIMTVSMALIWMTYWLFVI